MRVTFPAMKGRIGQRVYYSCLMKLNVIPKMFTFRDWIEFTPEDREQRVLNKKRVPTIGKYILDNDDGYIFSSITASYRCEVEFTPMGEDGLGMVSMDFEDANFVINDGQHRCAAIAYALKENPALADESISVLLFPYENRARVQQMFSDLNRFVAKTSKSLNILYDKRDDLARLTLDVVDRVWVFEGMVEKDAISLPARSGKMFSLAALYDANQELLRGLGANPDRTFNEQVEIAVEYWTAMTKAIPIWSRVRKGELRSIELRQENISTHAVVLRALGALGGELLKEFPLDRVKGRLLDLTSVDWRKANVDWENICIVANSVVSNRQARLATKAYLKHHLGLSLTDSERRTLPIEREDGDREDKPTDGVAFGRTAGRLTSQTMHSRIRDGFLEISFDGGESRRWELPQRDDKDELRRSRTAAADFARENDATVGQINAVYKTLTDAGYLLTR